jgi:purine-nucleoside phosphorylase
MFGAVPVLLHPTAPVAADALLPGDPSRALALAQALLGEPRMSNHAHGLWGYHGYAADGHALTIQATGIGAPSGAMVLADLAELGTTAAVRVGPCVSLGTEHRIGDLLVVERAIAADGTSAALGAGRSVEPDPGLLDSLRTAAGKAGRPASVATVDLVWDPAPGRRRQRMPRTEELLSDGAVAADMQAAALLSLGERVGVAVGCLLVVSDTVEGPSSDAAEPRLAEASALAGEIGAAALRASGGAAEPAQESASDAATPS